MDSLPNELLTHIVSFAIFNRSIGRLIMVNWRFNAIATRTRDSIGVNTLQDCTLMIRYTNLKYKKLYADKILHDLAHNQHKYVVNYTLSNTIIKYPYTAKLNSVSVIVRKHEILLDFPSITLSHNYTVYISYKNLDKNILDKINIIEAYKNTISESTRVFII